MADEGASAARRAARRRSVGENGENVGDVAAAGVDDDGAGNDELFVDDAAAGGAVGGVDAGQADDFEV